MINCSCSRTILCLLCDCLPLANGGDDSSQQSPTLRLLSASLIRRTPGAFAVDGPGPPPSSASSSFSWEQDRDDVERQQRLPTTTTTPRQQQSSSNRAGRDVHDTMHDETVMDAPVKVQGRAGSNRKRRRLCILGAAALLVAAILVVVVMALTTNGDANDGKDKVASAVPTMAPTMVFPSSPPSLEPTVDPFARCFSSTSSVVLQQLLRRDYDTFVDVELCK